MLLDNIINGGHWILVNPSVSVRVLTAGLFLALLQNRPTSAEHSPHFLQNSCVLNFVWKLLQL